MLRIKAWSAVAVLSGLAAAPAAWAAPALTITEMYIGVPGEDVTADWFEITNLGDMAWDLGANPLWYDDSSAAVAEATPINNLTTIAPDESVVVVIGGLADLATFFSAWDDGGQLSGVQIGYSDGAGLGQTSDTVNIFDDLTDPGNVVASQEYTTSGTLGSTLIYNPNTDLFGDSAVVGQFGAYAAPGGPAGDAGEYPLIGSPGVIPEPGSLALLGVGALTLVRRRR